MIKKRFKRLIMGAFAIVTLFAFSGVALADSRFPNDDWNYSLFGYVQNGTSGAKAIAVQWHCYTYSASMTINEVDGIIGTNSVNYIKEYQRRNGLPVDGKVGTQTWRSMRSHLHEWTKDWQMCAYKVDGPYAQTGQVFEHHDTGVWTTYSRFGSPFNMN